ncbi:MAG: PHP-associated domain-containing protein [Halobacteriales archaeon]
MTGAPARVDLHVKVLTKRVVDRAKARGLDAVVYAPHFRRLPEIRERAARFSEAELTVIPAREVFTGSWQNRKHVLGIGLEEPIPDFITLDGAIEELTRQEAAILVPHPTFLTVSLSAADLRARRDRIHAVETYNPKHWPHHNRRARALQGELGIPAFTSSYAHLGATVGESWTVFPGLDPTEAALRSALRSGHPRSVERRRGAGHQLHCALEFGHLCVENTWKKFDRVLLSGPEATHPGRPAYRGRFDDVRVDTT